jgi:hypothetical protein
MTRMPRVKKLPTRAEFLRKDVNVVEDCAICHEAFSSTHQPARITNSKCTHIFGARCIRKWSNSNNEQANTCPLCREELFKKPKVPAFTNRAMRVCTIYVPWLNSTHSRDTAKSFIREFWRQLWPLQQELHIYDCEIDHAIFKTILLHAGKLEFGRFPRVDSWPGLRSVAKEMVKVHYENEEYKELTARQLAYKWMPTVGDALGWRFTREENVEAESGDEDDSDNVVEEA